MKQFIPYLTLIIVFISIQPLSAQDNIPVTTLELEADMLPVENVPGKIFKASKVGFGNFRMTEGKKGVIKTRQKGNFWGTKSQSTTSQNASFTFTDGVTSAFIELRKIERIKETHAFPVGKTVSIGEEKVLDYYDSLLAIINLDSSNSWSLKIDVGGLAYPFEDVGIVEDSAGAAVYKISTIHSKVKTKRMMPPLPARGFVFSQNNEEVAAVQIMGSGIGGPAKRFVWLKRDQQPEKKLILASTMAVLLTMVQMPGF